MEIPKKRNKINNSKDLLIEIARTQFELEYSKHFVKEYNKRMFNNFVTQSFDIISIAEIGYKIASKLFSKGSSIFKKKKNKEPVI